LNGEALEYLQNLSWSKAAWRLLQSWSGEQDLDENSFLCRLQVALPKLSQQQRKALIDAAAVPLIMPKPLFRWCRC